MKTRTLLIATLLAGALVLPAANPKDDRSVDATAAFARLKTMVGHWEADSKAGKEALDIELIAAGTSLVERETATNRPAMLTVYHLDNGRLILTHFCMAGNQPRMQAQAFRPEKGELEFQFLDATNLASGGGHMHSVKIRFVDENHVSTDWQFYEKDKPTFSEASLYTRVR